MINIMSYVGMSMQAEVCMWTLLGLMRTIFDATLFKVNANLKQVWKMKMPPQLSIPVQRVLRTMVSGVMLVQCFTLYVYLAVYIVLLYPVFLEERPTLVLPWLLLAAIRKLLCELISLALGLGTCVLLGPAKPPCVRFLITKVITIAIASYMWILVLNYYHTLKMATAFKTFPAVVPPVDRDFGLELAVRRRRTKSLFDEDQLRRKILAGLYTDRPSSVKPTARLKFDDIPHMEPSHESTENVEDNAPVLRNLSNTSNRTLSDIVTFEDCLSKEPVVPRDTDRILEQFVIMSLRIATYLAKDGSTSTQYLDTFPTLIQSNAMTLDCNALSSEHTEPSSLVGSTKGKVASYLTNYPQIFMKKTSDIIQCSKADVNKIPDKETESRAVGNLDPLYINDQTDFHTENTFVDLNDQMGKKELKVISKNKSDIQNKKETSLEKVIELKINKSDISMNTRSGSKESLEYVVNKKRKQNSNESILTDDNQSSSDCYDDDKSHFSKET